MSEEIQSLTLLRSEQPTLTQLILVNMPTGTGVEEANRVALKEISNFEMVLQERPELKNCNSRSVLYAVKQCISDGLTLAPSAGLAYLLPGKVKIGIENNKDVYEWNVKYSPTANGKLSIAYAAGSILDVKRPYFTYNESGAVKTVTVEFLVPSHPEPRWEVITFDQIFFDRLKAASAKKNNGSANANYSSWKGGIDPEFAGTKAILHGLNKRGTNSNMKRNFVVPKSITNTISVTAIEKEKTDIAETIEAQINKVVHDAEATIIPNTNEDLPV